MFFLRIYEVIIKYELKYESVLNLPSIAVCIRLRQLCVLSSSRSTGSLHSWQKTRRFGQVEKCNASMSHAGSTCPHPSLGHAIFLRRHVYTWCLSTSNALPVNPQPYGQLRIVHLYTPCAHRSNSSNNLMSPSMNRVVQLGQVAFRNVMNGAAILLLWSKWSLMHSSQKR